MEYWVKSIRDVQPKGPYYLAAFSSGGTFAYARTASIDAMFCASCPRVSAFVHGNGGHVNPQQHQRHVHELQFVSLWNCLDHWFRRYEIAQRLTELDGAGAVQYVGMLETQPVHGPMLETACSYL